MRDLLRQGNSRKSSPVEGIFKFNPDATVVKHHGRCRWEWGSSNLEGWQAWPCSPTVLFPRSASLSFDAFSHPYRCSKPSSSSSPSQKDRAIKTYSIVVVVTTDSNGCPDDWRNKHFTRISAKVYLPIELAV